MKSMAPFYAIYQAESILATGIFFYCQMGGFICMLVYITLKIQTL